MLTRGSTKKRIIDNYQLYLFLLPTILIILVFKYFPMYGIKMAFVDFIPGMKMSEAPWKGLYWFQKFLDSPYLWTIIKNTLVLTGYTLLIGFPAPIVLSLMLNQLTSERYKRLIQTVTYAPYFISMIVLVGMMFLFLSPSVGVVNAIIKMLGGNPVFFMGSPEMFSTLYVFSGVWQSTGFGAIIYIAALSGINPELYEAAVMDGATRFQKIIHIDIPSIMPTIVIMFIMAAGNMLNVGFEKVFAMQTDLNKESSEVIATYVYTVGIKQMQYSYSTAINLVTSVVNMAMLLIVNKIAKKMSGTSFF